MKTVFVIEQGTYSDYRVVGVYSSRANAEKAMLHINDRYDAPSIAEWPLDPEVDKLNQGLLPWLVYMGFNGDTTSVEKRDLNYGISDELRVTAPRNQIYCEVWAESSEAAIKIVNERRTRAIAEGRLNPATGELKPLTNPTTNP